jgi:hypothetical protein
VQYIEIVKDLIPYRFEISVLDELFTMEVHYNNDYDFYTVNLERDGEVLVTGEKLVYGRQLFQDVRDGRYPKLPLIPYDESGQQHQVNASTLSESVFLMIWNEGDANELA